jgi:hypothetical protein
MLERPIGAETAKAPAPTPSMSNPKAKGAAACDHLRILFAAARLGAISLNFRRRHAPASRIPPGETALRAPRRPFVFNRPMRRGGEPA